MSVYWQIPFTLRGGPRSLAANGWRGHSGPQQLKQEIFGAHVCKVTFNHFPKPLIKSWVSHWIPQTENSPGVSGKLLKFMCFLVENLGGEKHKAHNIFFLVLTMRPKCSKSRSWNSNHGLAHPCYPYFLPVYSCKGACHWHADEKLQNFSVCLKSC